MPDCFANNLTIRQDYRLDWYTYTRVTRVEYEYQVGSSGNPMLPRCLAERGLGPISLFANGLKIEMGGRIGKLDSTLGRGSGPMQSLIMSMKTYEITSSNSS